MSKEEFVRRATRDLGITPQQKSSREYKAYRQTKKTSYLKWRKRQACR